MRGIWKAAALAAGLALAGLAAPAEAKEVALSFDDAPRPSSALMTGETRTQALINALAQAKVRQAVIFANPREFGPEQEARLRAYAGAGHLIANHSLTHPNLDDLSAADFLDNVAAADRLLRPLPNYRPWFRFPYLSQGATVEKRDAVRAGLGGLGLRQGYVTINTWDWRFDSDLDAAIQRGDGVDMDAMRDLYVETIVDWANLYDAMARRWLRRSPRHVMLLHENDLAALFLTDLVAALRADGWRIITPDRAYRDRIARRDPDTLWLGQGQVAALARVAGAGDDDLRIRYESRDYLDRLFAERVITRTSASAAN